ncbi:hypothetical protein EsH8_I_000344 [Colletotrichum jinshuiense]
MWLINTTTLNLEEFTDPSVVKYAILSHTWGKDEVSMQDMAYLPRAKAKAGFAKIAKTCEIALQKGLGYAWVDTCCIDKASSAELSEAINSMFRWYKDAYVCFVFLSDLSPEHVGYSYSKSPVTNRPTRELAACRWFSRGWTLQELIAPVYVEFYDGNWNFRFTKDGEASTLSALTKIDVDILMFKNELKNVPVAVKMSWAAYRETTRAEDRAYSLLGLFDINMSMLYGEGVKAFQRLQQEIVRETDDLSIFAWLGTDTKQAYRGAFAKSPLEFAFCDGFKHANKLLNDSQEFSITNKGVRTNAELLLDDRNVCTIYLGGIAELCGRCGHSHKVFAGLLFTANGWVRVSPAKCWPEPQPTNVRQMDIYLRREVTWDESRAIERVSTHSFNVTLDWEGAGWDDISVLPQHLWDPLQRAFVGKVLTGEFMGVVIIGLNMPMPLVFHLLVYRSVDGNVRVVLYAEPSTGWEILEGLRPQDHAMLPLGKLLEMYRRLSLENVGNAGTRVRASRRGKDGRALDMTFEVCLEDDLSIVISQVASPVRTVKSGSNSKSSMHLFDRRFR